MKPIKFKDQTHILGSMKKVGGGSTPRIPFRIENNGMTVSCWRASFLERLSFLFHGKVWIGVNARAKQPQMWAAAIPNAYVKKTKRKKNDKGNSKKGNK